MKLLFRVPAELRALAKALRIHAGAGRWTELTASRIHGLIDGIVERLAKLESEEKGGDLKRVVDAIDALTPLLPSYEEILSRIDAETDGVGLHANVKQALGRALHSIQVNSANMTPEKSKAFKVVLLTGASGAGKTHMSERLYVEWGEVKSGVQHGEAW